MNKKIKTLIAIAFVAVIITLSLEKDEDGVYSITWLATKRPAAIKIRGSQPQPKPIIELKNKNKKPDLADEREQAVILQEGYGTFPQRPVDDPSKLNRQQKYILKALKDPENNSGAISIFGKQTKFDSKKWKSDKKYKDEYLNSPKPNRSYETAKAGPKVKRIERVGYGSIHTEQNVPVELKVKGRPGYPVSILAIDGGEFANKLSFETLEFDSQGLCIFLFTPTRGVINQCKIRCSSPAHSGTVTWTVVAHLSKEIIDNTVLKEPTTNK